MVHRERRFNLIGSIGIRLSGVGFVLGSLYLAAFLLTAQAQAAESPRLDSRPWSTGEVRAALANPIGPKPLAGRSTSFTAPRGQTSLRHSPVPGGLYNPAVGKLLVRFKSGSGHCSATLIDTPSGRLVLTAAHCLHDWSGWVRRVRFLPGFDDGRAYYNTWGAVNVLVPNPWYRTSWLGPFALGNFDLGIVKLRRQIPGVEPMGFVRNPSRYRGRARLFGYPGGAMKGRSVRMCTSPTWRGDQISEIDPGPTGMVARCNMAAGSSGGPWTAQIPDGYGNESTMAIGLTSSGWSNKLWSPYFGSRLGSLIRDAER